MNYEWLGIIVAIGVVVGLFGFHLVTEHVLIDTVNTGYYDYCAKMNIDCQ